MRFDGSDVSSIGVIAFGSVVGLLGTGAMIERLDDAPDGRDEQVIELRAVPTDPTTEKLLETYPPIRLQPRIRPTVDLRNGPVIFIDGVRIGTTSDPRVVFDDLDPNAVERVSVRAGTDQPEIHIELKRRR